MRITYLNFNEFLFIRKSKKINEWKVVRYKIKMMDSRAQGRIEVASARMSRTAKIYPPKNWDATTANLF